MYSANLGNLYFVSKFTLQQLFWYYQLWPLRFLPYKHLRNHNDAKDKVVRAKDGSAPNRKNGPNGLNISCIGVLLIDRPQTDSSPLGENPPIPRLTNIIAPSCIRSIRDCLQSESRGSQYEITVTAFANIPAISRITLIMIRIMYCCQLLLEQFCNLFRDAFKTNTLVNTITIATIMNIVPTSRTVAKTLQEVLLSSL